MEHRWINLYSVYDTVAQEYGPLFEAISDDVAQRSYYELIVNSRFASEYNLVKKAKYCKVFGEIDTSEPAKLVCSGIPEKYVKQ